jgi:hypothetical protein
MTDDRRKFTMLQHDADGELHHAEVVDVTFSSWGTTVALPAGIDVRNGDVISIMPKPEREPLAVDPKQEEVVD